MFKGYDQFIPVKNKKPLVKWLDPTTWGPLDPSVEQGFVFTDRDPYFFVDVDHALDDNGWSDFSKLVLSKFPGCAVEISSGGKGLHIFGKGGLPPTVKHRRSDLGLEVYTEGRYAVITRRGLQGSTEVDGQAGLNWLMSEYLTADKIISKLLKKESTFGTTASFKQLWTGDIDTLIQFYPASTPLGYDPSAADMALLSHLAREVGDNAERIETLFNQSALAARDKWRDREDYRARSIRRAIDTTVKRPASTGGSKFMDVDAQRRHFAGCVYLIHAHRVYVPHIGALKPDQFRAAFGGYSFRFKPGGNAETNAFKVFTESQLFEFPKAHLPCFRPELTPGALIKEEGLTYLNTYYPADTRRVKGDARPFLSLLESLYPRDRDRTILLSYIAACVQYPGIKFQWAPVLQGVEGNGKTLIANAVAFCVGNKYSHFPNITALGKDGMKFTGWLCNKLFIVFEDVYQQGDTNFQEILKPLITNTKIEIQFKGQDQYTGDNRANFMLLGNPKDLIRKDKNDRRYCMLYSAQQTPADLKRDGMNGRYFPDLYKWARADGFAIINNYLRAYKIPDKYNPAVDAHRAPATSSTKEAYILGTKDLIQEIIEAEKSEISGFKHGFVSSVALETLISDKKLRISQNKRKMLLNDAGYVRLGRLSVKSPIDAGMRPVIYLKKESPLFNSTVCSKDLIGLYLKSQTENFIKKSQNIIYSNLHNL